MKSLSALVPSSALLLAACGCASISTEEASITTSSPEEYPAIYAAYLDRGDDRDLFPDPGWLEYCGTNGFGLEACLIDEWTYEDLVGVSQAVNLMIEYADDLDSRARREHFEVFPPDRLGDCDNYAMSKQAALLGMGFPADQTWLTKAIVLDAAGNNVGGHLYLVVELDGVLYALDSLINASDTNHFDIYEIGEEPYPRNIVLVQDPDGRWLLPAE